MLPKVDAGTPQKRRSFLAEPLSPPEGFRRIEITPMLGWDTPGQKTVGYFVGLRPSPMFEGRTIVDLVDDHGTVQTWGCPMMLAQFLLGVPARTPVLIHYRGEEENEKGRGTTKQFEVFIGS